VALPAFARRTPLLQQSIDIFRALGPQQQTCCRIGVGKTCRIGVVGPRWDRDGQTDGRTPYRFIDPAPHTIHSSIHPSIKFISEASPQLKKLQLKIKVYKKTSTMH